MNLLPPKYEKNWEIYAVLLFLGFFFFHFPSLSPFEIIACFAGVLCFAALYFHAHWLSGFRAASVIAAIIILGAALNPINLGSSVFFTFAAGLSGLLLAPKGSILAIFLITAVYVGESFILGRAPVYFLAHGFLIVVIGAIYIQVRRSELIAERLRRREEEIEAMTLYGERRRIAGDLHDFLGQAFSIVSVKSALVRKLLDSEPPRASIELDDIAETARMALAKVRATIMGYNEAALAHELDAARVHLKAADIKLTVEHECERLSSVSDTLLALILRECVTNVVRHSKAKNCKVSVINREDAVEMSVCDDGVGYSGGEGAGVRGMRERAAQLGAQFEITSANGACIRVLTAYSNDEERP